MRSPLSRSRICLASSMYHAHLKVPRHMRDRNNKLCGNAVSRTRMNFSRIPTKDKRSSKVHVVDYTYSSDFRNTVVCKQYIAYDTPRYTVLFHRTGNHGEHVWYVTRYILWKATHILYRFRRHFEELRRAATKTEAGEGGPY